MGKALLMALEIEKTLKYIISVKARERSIIQAEAELNRQLNNVFGNTFNEVISQLQRSGRVPSNDLARRQLIAGILNKEDDFIRAIINGTVDMANYGRERVVQELIRLGRNIRFDEFSPTVRGLINEHTFEASRRTMRRIVGNVMGNLTQSYQQGLGIADAAQNLLGEFVNIQGYELERIARTEINSMQNVGAHLTVQEYGVEYEQWWSAEDERVRDGIEASHVEMHGQIVRTDGTFSNGLKYPGDRSQGVATIAEWINCRCRLVPFIMPEGHIAPPGKEYFYENDIISIAS